MGVNADKPGRWKQDIARSVDAYNDWFMRFAPKAYRDTRVKTTKQVEAALESTANLTNIAPALLRAEPSVVQMLRMCTAPPIARDRLIGLAKVSGILVHSMEGDKHRLPPRMPKTEVDAQLARIGDIILRLADRDIFTWLDHGHKIAAEEVHRAATVVADRLCGALADPIIRNAQEARQLAAIGHWLEARKYTFIGAGEGTKLDAMRPGTFCFRLNVPVDQGDGGRKINIPVDVAIMRHRAKARDLPLLIEAKSAGDFTNVNKRRKEEATKVGQLRHTYGVKIRYVLFLGGYFDSGYLGYEAAEGIDWVWEHRIDELAQFGL
jgi:hypothetical protein